jgi:hypothetical protein
MIKLLSFTVTVPIMVLCKVKVGVSILYPLNTPHAWKI